MIRFGHRNKHETLAKPSNRYASTPLDAPGNIYTNRRRQEVDAEGDLDDLMQQEIQRYEELFEQTNGAIAPYGDDDTLQDGSIYTSTTGLQASMAMFPPMNRTYSHQPVQEPKEIPQEEDTSLWGLTREPLPLSLKPAGQTSLLKPHEATAAQACAVKSEVKSSIPPVSLDNEKNHKKVSNSNCTPAPEKKNKFMPKFPRRLFRTSSTAARMVPPTPKNQTPLTQASTPAPASSGHSKAKFFSAAKLFQHNSSKSSSNENSNNISAKQHHPNLLLASFSAVVNQRKESKQAEAAASPTNADQSNHHHPDETEKHRSISPLRLRKTVSAPPMPSPPPPIEHCEIRMGGDGMSVGSAQSSLTDALDTWMMQNTPPKIIGGNHLQDLSPSRLEAYEGGLSPYHSAKEEEEQSINNNNKEEKVCEEKENNPSSDQKDSAASPGSVLLTEEGLYLHNHQSKSLGPSSPIRVKHSEDGRPKSEGDLLAAAVWADKQQRQLLKEIRDLVHEDVNPEDADIQVVKILGLEGDGVSDQDDVRRNLFGDANAEENDAGNEEPDKQVDVSLEPLQETVVIPDDGKDCKQVDAAAAEANDEESKKDTSICLSASGSSCKQHKSSKFKKFLSKLVHATGSQPHQSHNIKNKQQNRQQQWLEKERIKAAEAEEERLRNEEEEAQRIQEKRRLELERQRALERGSETTGTSHSTGTGDGRTARSLSLVTGKITAETDTGVSPAPLPTVGENDVETPTPNIPPSDTACIFCQRLDHPRTHIVIPCMHYVLCDECVELSREASSGCHCPTCDTTGFLYARVGVLEGHELQDKLLQVSGAGRSSQMQAMNQ